MEGASGIKEITNDADRETFDELVTIHRPRIFRFALASLRDPDAAETVTQDCFMRAYKAWSGFRRESSLPTWLTSIVLNLIRDPTKSRRFQFWKRAHATAVLADAYGSYIPDAGSLPEECISAKQQVAAVWKATDRLSPSQRTIFLLHFMEEMDIAEIEAATGFLTRQSGWICLAQSARFEGN